MDTVEKGETCIVDIWRLSFDNAMTYQSAWALLNMSERKRANAFYFEYDRHHFVLSRAFLRRVLGQYSATPPSNISFTLGPYGKPFLADRNDPLRFNLSHCKTTCIVAITKGCEIGVDVENPRAIGDRDLLIQSVLTLGEQKAINATSPEFRSTLFLRFWTQKEAILKASGYGLRIEPDQIDLEANMQDGSILHLAIEENEVSNYHIFNLSDGDLIAALAVRDPLGKIQLNERGL